MTHSLAQKIRATSRLSGNFKLRSGKISNTYFDKYQFEAQPGLLLEIATEMAALIPKETDVLAGLEMGGIPLATVLSQVSGLPTAFIRKEAKEYGTCRYAEGANFSNKKFILVEDVVSSGGAILDALEKLRADGLEPSLALCVIDRETGGKEALASAGLQLVSLFTYTQIENAR